MRGLLLLTVLAVSACASTPKEKFDLLSLGMDKSAVIDQVGNPDKTQRIDSQDIWTYKYQTEENVVEHEVVFKEGFVTYTGAPRTPVTAKTKTEEEAAFVLKKELKKEPAKHHNFKDIKEDGTFEAD